MKKYGVTHQTSSTYSPHANTWAEVGVKSMKRLMANNLENSGSLDSDKFVSAVLSYQNTPHKTCKMSTAKLVFSWQINDLFPHTGEYNILRNFSKSWQERLKVREVALSCKSTKDHERWSEKTWELPP